MSKKIQQGREKKKQLTYTSFTTDKKKKTEKEQRYIWKTIAICIIVVFLFIFAFIISIYFLANRNDYTQPTSSGQTSSGIREVKTYEKKTYEKKTEETPSIRTGPRVSLEILRPTITTDEVMFLPVKITNTGNEHIPLDELHVHIETDSSDSWTGEEVFYLRYNGVTVANSGDTTKGLKINNSNLMFWIQDTINLKEGENIILQILGSGKVLDNQISIFSLRDIPINRNSPKKYPIPEIENAEFPMYGIPINLKD